MAPKKKKKKKVEYNWRGTKRAGAGLKCHSIKNPGANEETEVAASPRKESARAPKTLKSSIPPPAGPTVKSKPKKKPGQKVWILDIYDEILHVLCVLSTLVTGNVNTTF